MAVEWQKPTVWSVAIIAGVLGFLAYLVHRDKLTVTESLIGAVLGLLTWVTKGARPRKKRPAIPVDVELEPGIRVIPTARTLARDRTKRGGAP